MRKFFVPIVILLFTTACFEELPEQSEEKNTTNLHEALVQEVIHAGTYTYLRVSEERGENWLAVPKMETKPGDIFYYQGGLPMKNFKSKELDRVFAMVLFLEKLYKSPDEMQNTTKSPHSASNNKPKVAKSKINVEPLEGGIKISELFTNKKNYSGKTVKLRGQVIKFSANIMNTNWVHIQDGTEHEGKYDLVVTSNRQFKVGDIVIIEGKVSLDKDFGHGHSYEIIIEEAVAKITKSI